MKDYENKILTSDTYVSFSETLKTYFQLDFLILSVPCLLLLQIFCLSFMLFYQYSYHLVCHTCTCVNTTTFCTVFKDSHLMKIHNEFSVIAPPSPFETNIHASILVYFLWIRKDLNTQYGSSITYLHQDLW